MKNVLISLLFVMLSSITLFAEDPQTWEIGHPVRADVTATLDNGVLMISGTGAMVDFDDLEEDDQLWSLTDNIISVHILGGVTNVGKLAFANHTSITSVSLPAGLTTATVTTIGDSAFEGCSSLYRITIPRSVTSIGEKAFASCSGLTTVTVDESNAVYRSAGNCIIQIADNALVLGTKDSEIPIAVTSILPNAFYGCTDLESITIPAAVARIGASAFEGCTGLTSVNLPIAVTVIEENAFAGCTLLTIFAEVDEEPAGWDEDWNPDDIDVIWEYHTLKYPPRELAFMVTGYNVSLEWHAPVQWTPDFLGYKVYDDDDVLTVSPISGLYHDAHALSSGKHTFKVRAVYDGGVTNPTISESDPDSSIVYIGYNPPTALSVVPDGSDLALSWAHPVYNAPIELVGYRVERREGTDGTFALATDGEIDTIDPATPPSYTDETVALGTTYYYRVIAMYSTPDHESSPSETVSGINYAPNQPQVLTNTVSGQDVTLTWIAPTYTGDSLIGYLVYRGTILLTADESDPLIEAPIIALTHTDLGAPSGMHTYKVIAVFTSENATPIETIAYVGFNAPASLSAIDGIETVNLSWTAPVIQSTVFLNGYRVERKVSESVWTPINVEPIPDNLLTYTDIKVTPWALYEYRVVALYLLNPEEVDEEEYMIHPSEPSNVASAKGYILAAATNLAGIPGNREVELSWTAPEQPLGSDLAVTGYKIYRNGQLLPSPSMPITPMNPLKFRDEYQLFNGSEYTYYITAVYSSLGDSEPTNSITVTPSATPNADGDLIGSVRQTALVGNYPNPFNPETTIRFAVSSNDVASKLGSHVRIDIYNIKGQLVRRLVNDVYSAGEHSVVWNGCDDSGRGTSSGLYFYRMSVEGFSSTKKMLLMK